MGSSGGVWAQPVLGKAADVYGYPSSYLISAGISVLAIPALVFSRRQNSPADTLEISEVETEPTPEPPPPVPHEMAPAHSPPC